MSRMVLVLCAMIASFMCFGDAVETKAQTITVRGTVVDEFGDVLQKVEVVAYGIPGVSAITGEEGQFLLHFSAKHKGEKVTILFSKEGYRPDFIDKYVVPDKDTRLDPVKLQTLFIEGYLYRKTHDAIKGAIITVAQQPSLQDTTDSEGHFKIVSSDLTYHPPPGITIWIRINGGFYEDTCRMNVVNTTYLDVGPIGKSRVGKDRVQTEEPAGVHPTPAEACTVYFRITDIEDAGIEGVNVMVQEIPSMIAITDVRGRAILVFEDDCADRQVRIWIRKEGFESSYKDIILQKGTMSLTEAQLEGGVHTLKPPRLRKPPDRTSNLYDQTPTFEWECLEGCSYDLQVDDESDFLSPEINRADLNACHYISREELNFGTYYWRVRSRKKATGSESEWSLPWIVSIEEQTIPGGGNVNPARRLARNRAAAWRSLLAPGWGQIYKGHPEFGVGFWAALGATTGISMWAHKEYRDHRDNYSGNLNVWEIEKEYDEANKYYKLRNRLLYIGLPVIWIVNVGHAYFSKDVRAEEKWYGEIRYDLMIREGQVRFAFTKSF